MTAVRSTVIVVTWRGRDHITSCLDALDAQVSPHRTVIVDNASDDGTAELIAGRTGVRRLARNLGYAGALAEVLPEVDTEFVAWLNDDTAPDPGWLAAMEQALDENPAAAAASARLESADGTVTSLGTRLTPLGYGADVTTTEIFGFCGGAALLRTEPLRAAGGVPREFFCYYEDTDTAWRLRLAGWTVVAVPRARVRHVLSASTRPGSRPFHRWNERNRLLMLVHCAPAGVVYRELVRFAGITALLPLRRQAPEGLNFEVRLRVQVLAEVIIRLAPALRRRWRIGRRSAVGRRMVWRTFAG
jgi:GT2 family glycosyltransferase